MTSIIENINDLVQQINSSVESNKNTTAKAEDVQVTAEHRSISSVVNFSKPNRGYVKEELKRELRMIK